MAQQGGSVETRNEPAILPNLTDLANRFGSDKGTTIGGPPHRYTYLYDLILDRYRDKSISFLELGLARGGPEVVGGKVERTVSSPSVAMWLAYFPTARIYGFDISDFSHLQDPRFHFIRGDAGREADVARLASAAPAFDVVIDDGSHASHHQQLAFRHLFPKLSPGGTYIIEDLHWQSPNYEGELGAVPLTRDLFIDFFEKSTYRQSAVLPIESLRAAASEAASFAWFPAFDGRAAPAKVLVIRKVNR